MGPGLAAPGYLPPQAVEVLPWTRGYVARFARAQHVDVDDCSQAAVAALVRATVHYDPDAGARFSTYSARAVQVACWRVVGYWLRGKFVRNHRSVPLEDAELLAPSAEDEVLARETVRGRL